MASCKKDHLECPVCIDIIKNAMILNCGHTFCQGCLEKINYNASRRCLSCPVCRAETTCTKGWKGIEGLPRNVMINSLVADYQMSLNSAKACPFHEDHEKEYFCQECKVHICMRCVVTGHLNHPMKTKEEFEREIHEKIDCLMQRGQAKKEDMERVIACTEAPKAQVASAVVNLERCIKNAFARKSRLLKENETFLLEEIYTLQRRYDSSIDVDTIPYKQVVQDINRALAVITADDPGSSEADSLASHTMVCNDLDELLNKVLAKIDAGETGRAKEAVMNAEFHQSGDELLNLGMVKTKQMELVMMDVNQLPPSVDQGLAAQSEDTAKVENGACRSHGYRVKECDIKCQFTEADDYGKDPEICDNDEFGLTEADCVENLECDDDDFALYSDADYAKTVMQNEMERHVRSCTEADNVENSKCDDDDFALFWDADYAETMMQNEIDRYTFMYSS